MLAVFFAVCIEIGAGQRGREEAVRLGTWGRCHSCGSGVMAQHQALLWGLKSILKEQNQKTQIYWTPPPLERTRQGSLEKRAVLQLSEGSTSKITSNYAANVSKPQYNKGSLRSTLWVLILTLHGKYWSSILPIPRHPLRFLPHTKSSPLSM